MPRILLLLLFCYACSSTEDTGKVSAPPAAPPNVLLILADDLGWADLNCYGNPLVHSPHLDALAREGIQFMQAYAAAPTGEPSRGSLQTGLHPARLPNGLKPRHKTLAELVSNSGYRTAYIGKWALEGRPEDQGYEFTYASGSQEQPDSFYYPFFKHELFPELLADTRQGDYLTDALTTRSLRVMEDLQDTSWLLCLNYYAPHAPIEGRKDRVDYYRQLIRNSHYRRFPSITYAAMISAIDDNVGRLVDKLRELGQLDNTLVIFASDNGGVNGEHTDNGILRGGKGSVFEGGIRIPFIIHYPAVTNGNQAQSTPILLTDIYPTVAEALGIRGKTPDGRSLLPLLRGSDTKERVLVWRHTTGDTTRTALRRGSWKMIQNEVTDSVTYHDMDRFPDELRGQSAVPEGQRDLKRISRRWKRRTIGR